MKIFFRILFITMLAIPTYATVFANGPVNPNGPPVTFTEEQYHKLFHQVIDLADHKHVVGGSRIKMYQKAINGILQSLDQHSAYMSPEFIRENSISEKTEFSGIGATIDPRNGTIRIIRPITEDAPMIKGGMKAGDVIMEIEVDGKMVPTRTMTSEEAVSNIKGPEGSSVKFRIMRAEKLIYRTVVRGKVVVPVVYSGTIDTDTIYVRLTQFVNGSAADILDAYNKRKGELGHVPKYFILDLRFNPGGVLPEAITISDGLLNKGRIVTTIGRGDVTYSSANATDGLIIPNNVGVAILVNNFSASASEIVAGSVQDLADQRDAQTIIVGNQTFGKGSVQQVMPTPDGGAIKITIAKYYTASGKTIDGVGVTPDYEVSLKDGETLPEYKGAITKLDTQLAEALRILREE